MAYDDIDCGCLGVIGTFVLVFFGSITMITIGGIIIHENNHLSSYSETICSGLSDSYVKSLFNGYYYCGGYASVKNTNGTIVGMAKLINPAYNNYLIRVKHNDCTSWISSLVSNSNYTCYVDNIYSNTGIGYTTLQNIAGFYASMIIGVLILAFLFGFFIYLKIQKQDIKNPKKNDINV